MPNLVYACAEQISKLSEHFVTPRTGVEITRTAKLTNFRFLDYTQEG